MGGGTSSNHPMAAGHRDQPVVGGGRRRRAADHASWTSRASPRTPLGRILRTTGSARQFKPSSGWTTRRTRHPRTTATTHCRFRTHWRRRCTRRGWPCRRASWPSCRGRQCALRLPPHQGGGGRRTIALVGTTTKRCQEFSSRASTPLAEHVVGIVGGVGGNDHLLFGNGGGAWGVTQEVECRYSMGNRAPTTISRCWSRQQQWRRRRWNGPRKRRRLQREPVLCPRNTRLWVEFEAGLATGTHTT